jgi:prepilin-type N-terminal cleavage/methylation domain-containing protein
MKQQNEKGYTLVELLAVISILVVVGTIIASILTSVLRSSNKSTNTETVRANGNYAIAQMSKMITYAQKLEGVSVTGNFSDPTQYQTDCTAQASPPTRYKYIQIKSFDGGITTFSCANSQIASQSSTISTPVADWTSCATETGQCSFTGMANVRYGANGSYFYKILTNGTPCTNGIFGDPLVGTVKQCYYQPVSGVTNYLVNPSLSASCYFQCSQESAAAPAKIDIFLDLSAVSTAVFAESQATMHFETSVIARNNTTR